MSCPWSSARLLLDGADVLWSGCCGPGSEALYLIAIELMLTLSTLVFPPSAARLLMVIAGWRLLVAGGFGIWRQFMVLLIVDDEAVPVPCLIPLVWWGFPLSYHDCFMSAGSSLGSPAGHVFWNAADFDGVGIGHDAAAFVSCCWKPWAAVVVAVGSGFASCSG
ncbi:hypothetical protein Nepgr_028314 [Nepenthes gracilis]|uniref:Uncharacterized protein n=1 Tax=Nepenthes gracilis TaxID=150966 RepID=A0AAD3TC85_NEPGR|nr:hypothetical protein Nepgr_028314 [Nepenthes gracilis]